MMQSEKSLQFSVLPGKPLDKALRRAASDHEGVGGMTALLQHHENLPICEHIRVLAAANRALGPQMMALLLNHQPGTILTDLVIERAARNEICGSKILEVIIQHQPDIQFKVHIVQVAAFKKTNGLETMQVVLAHQPNLVVNSFIISIATANGNQGLDMVELILKHQPNLSIGAAALQQAKLNHAQGLHVMKFLLEHGGKPTEQVMISAVSDASTGLAFTTLLLQHYKAKITAPIMYAAVINKSPQALAILQCLLDHGGEVTATLLKLARVNQKHGQQLVELLTNASRR